MASHGAMWIEIRRKSLYFLQLLKSWPHMRPCGLKFGGEEAVVFPERVMAPCGAAWVEMVFGQCWQTRQSGVTPRGRRGQTRTTGKQKKSWMQNICFASSSFCLTKAPFHSAAPSSVAWRLWPFISCQDYSPILSSEK